MMDKSCQSDIPDSEEHSDLVSSLPCCSVDTVVGAMRFHSMFTNRLTRSVVGAFNSKMDTIDLQLEQQGQDGFRCQSPRRNCIDDPAGRLPSSSSSQSSLFDCGISPLNNKLRAPGWR